MDNQIHFENLQTKIEIGSWLAWVGHIKEKKILKKIKINAYKRIEIAEILAKLNIHTQILDDITSNFSKILNEIGINEPCTIKSLVDYHTFNCHLDKNNEDISIKLRVGGFLDGYTSISIKKDNINKIYKVIDKNNEIKYELHQYIINNKDNSNEYTYEIFSKTNTFTVTNKNNSITLSIENYGENKTNKETSLYIPNKDKLEEYFLNITFPKEIDTLYKEITDILGEDISKYFIFELSLLKNSKKNLILLKNGKLENFIITKNNKTIKIDKRDNWSYETTDIIARKKDTNINYSINSKSIKEIENQNIAENLTMITTEIEDTKKLTRTLLKNNSKQKGE